jgi:cell division initiation protein
MLTPQEVASHAFPKAVMGGYNMASVDEFLDELTDDYTALFKENAALKSKLKVLVEKVEDYRSTEDSMRATLVTAQKMADSIVKEAEQKRDQVLAQAESAARQKIGALQGEVTAAQERLKAGQRELADFVAESRAACSRQLDYLEQLPTLETAAETPAPQEPAQPAESGEEKPAVSEIEENILAKFGTEAPAEPSQDAASAEAPAEQPQPEYPQDNPFEPAEADEPTRRINLKDLKFGRNYSGAEDEDDN